ncbi:Mitogen-activated protein kinase 7 [Manis javanica]|nr:Mitogen-activated protein kinase 7 [Manis javanica]
MGVLGEERPEPAVAPESEISKQREGDTRDRVGYFPVQKVSSIHAHRQRTCEGAYFQHPHTPLQECSVSGKQIPNELQINLPIILANEMWNA